MMHFRRRKVSEFHISDLRPLSQLQELQSLSAKVNAVSDISPLLEIDGLEMVFLQDNPVPISQAEKLREVPSVVVFRTPMLECHRFSLEEGWSCLDHE